MKILILGGTGFVGRALCEALVEQGGHELTVPTRSPARHKAVAMLPGVGLAQADVHDPATLARLLVGCDAVVNLVAILHGTEAAFQRVHVDLPTRLAQAMQGAGVRRLVHVSALGVPDDAATAAPSRYLRSKAQGEHALWQAAKAGHLDLTVLRPSVIFGAQDRFLNLFADLQALFPVMPLGGASARFQPVWVGDVAQAIVRVLGRPDTTGTTLGGTFECTGPRVWTLAELVRFAAQCAGIGHGAGRPVLPLPDGLARLQATALSLLPGEPLMSTDNLDSMRVPNVATGRHPGLAALGITPAAVEAIAPAYLRQGATRLDVFRRLARR